MRMCSVADFSSSQIALGKEAVSSEPSVLLTDAGPEVSALLPEVGFDDQVI